MNQGDKFGAFHAEDYINCLCIAGDRERKTLTMFDTFLRPGVEVQLMRVQIDFEDVRRRARRLVEAAGDDRPFLALYINCGGRAGLYACTDREDAAEIQQAVGEIPLFGVYSGAEIARVRDQARRFNLTGVLSIFSERDG